VSEDTVTIIISRRAAKDVIADEPFIRSATMTEIEHACLKTLGVEE